MVNLNNLWLWYKLYRIQSNEEPNIHRYCVVIHKTGRKIGTKGTQSPTPSLRQIIFSFVEAVGRHPKNYSSIQIQINSHNCHPMDNMGGIFSFSNIFTCSTSCMYPIKSPCEWETLWDYFLIPHWYPVLYQSIIWSILTTASSCPHPYLTNCPANKNMVPEKIGYHMTIWHIL